MFIDGQDYDQTFSTSFGPVGVLAEIEVDGDLLRMKDFLIYPTEAEYLDLGTREVLRLAR